MSGTWMRLRELHKNMPAAALLWGLIVLMAVAQAWRYPVTLDDAYITFRHARNLAVSNGMTFNPGQPVMATTAPGLAVMLGGLTRTGLDTVTAGRLLGLLGLMLANGGLILLGWRWRRPVTGLAAGVILCFMPDLARAWGNECSLLIGLFVMGWLMLELRRPGFCALLMAVGCMVRPDFALAALLTAPFWWWRSRREFLIYAGSGLACSLLWLAAMQWLDASPMPHTLAVKRLQGLWIASGDARVFEGWLSFRRGLFWFLRRTVFDTPVGALVIIGGLLMIRLPRFLPLILWCVVHVGAYYLLGVPGHYYWYFYPLWLGIAVAIGEAIAVLGEALPEAHGRDSNSNWVPAAVTLGLTLYCGLFYLGRSGDGHDLEKSHSYRAMAALIRQNTVGGQSVMMNEIGEMGYRADCRVVDTHGLIHPEMPLVAINNIPAVVEEFEPDYIVLEGWLDHAGPDYRPRALAGDLSLRFPQGETLTAIEYRQIGRIDGFEHYLPVLLARDPLGSGPGEARRSPGVEHFPEN